MKKTIVFIFLAFILFGSCEQDDKKQVDDEIHSQKGLNDFLLQRWNTWNNSNYLQHILMPEGLSLSISFKSTYRDSDYPYYLDEVYISGSYDSGHEKIEPLAHTGDGKYTDLRISWKGLTTRIQSATQKGELFILYTPEVIPENPPIMIMETGLLWNKDGKVNKMNGFFQAEFGPITYSMESTEPDSMLCLPIVGDYISFRSDVPVGVYTGKKRSLEYIQRLISNREILVKTEQDEYGDQKESYKAIQTLLGWNQIFDAQNHRPLTPASRKRNEKWSGWVLSGWDSYFTAAIYALDNKYLAFSNLFAITNEVTDEGFVPNYSAALSNAKSYDRSQPPVGSMIAKLVYDKYPEKWVLEEVYENLLSWNRWWPEARDNQGFLSWGSNPIPGISESNTLQAAKCESGMEDSPLFDNISFNKQTHTMDLASVDLMSLYIADCKHLAEIATILGNEEDSKELLQRAEKYSLKLNELWDEEMGIYRDLNLTTKLFSNHLAPTNFYPLLAGVPSQDQAARMIEEHFMNPDEFFGEFMMPSIARNNPKFLDNVSWRGRIWAQMNFLVYLGLKNYNLSDAAKILAEKSNELFMAEWRDRNRVFENYNATTGEGGDVDNIENFYTTGGLLGLMKLMEEGYWNSEQ